MSGQNTLPSFTSGEPGSTGYEVFSDSTASGPAAQFREESGQHHGTAGDAVGIGSTARAGGDNEAYSAGAIGSGGLGSAGAGGLGGVGSHSHEHPHGHHSHDNSSTGSGLGGKIAAATGVGSESHSHSHSHHGQSGIEPSSQSQIGDSYGSNPTGNSGRDFDRTGNLDQNAALYERTGNQGPITGGAAGTDRFDTDKGADRTGATGNSFGTRDDYPVQDTTQRAEGKGTGGVLGALGTSDKDFTGRDRTGPLGGAYADTHGHYQSNTSGPGGASALTGREGNIENNPVAQAKSRVDEAATPHSSTTHGTHGTGTHADETAHKESLLEKAKHAVGL